MFHHYAAPSPTVQQKSQENYVGLPIRPPPRCANLASVTTRGQDIAARIERLGVPKNDFATKANVDRGTLGRALQDDPRIGARTWGKIESALTRLEQEIGMDGPNQPRPVGDPADDLVEFQLSDVFGVRAVVKGPVRDLPALQDAVSRIIADMQESSRAREEG